jgi:hypothetical protein
MSVRLEQDWPRDGFNLWIYDLAGQHIVIHRYEGDGVWRTDRQDANTQLGDPSLFLPRPILEDLIRASEGHVHAQDATVRHLDDVTSTRDRLLALIEKRGLR